MLKTLPRATLTNQAIDTLRRFILHEELAVGDQLPSERELSEVLGVSRNIVRDALSVLVTDGLIVKQPGRGIFVTEFDPSNTNVEVAVTVDSSVHDLQSIKEARAAIEIGAVDLMVQQVTSERIQQLLDINKTLSESIRNGRGGVQEDIAFHSALLETTKNSILIELTPLLVDYFRLNLYHNPSLILHNSERTIAEHQLIVDALQARDSAELRHALEKHLYM